MIDDQWHFISMTGLGHSRVHDNQIAIEVTFKSFNHRGLEIKYKLAEELSFLEIMIGSMLNKSLKRGHIEVYAKLEFIANKPPRIIIDEEKIKDLMAVFTKLPKKFVKLILPITMSDLLSFRCVINEIEYPLEKEDLVNLANKAIDNALSDLVLSRKKEGLALKIYLRDAFLKCLSLIEFIEDGQSKDSEKRFLSFKGRIEGLIKDFALEKNRLYQEFAFLTERSDFKEEIDRLKAHAHYFDSICKSEGAKGRKLDFLCQEMLRESNTVMSKAFDHGITLKAIELKAEVERIREQVQNIE
jgi:uncharacterized protein (TIGR00255 family)